MKNKPFPRFLDTTLRDGEQAPGVVFNLADKLTICTMLEHAGICEVEIGTPAIGANDFNDIRVLTGAGFNFLTSVWCRAVEDDIRLAAKCGSDGVHISFPVSDIHLKSLGKNKKWVNDNLKQLLDIAHDSFSFVTVGAQDASRANTNFLHDFIGMADAAGAARVRIADTVGLLTPRSTTALFNPLVASFPDVLLEFHAHNDLGLATANVLSAYHEGVDFFSVTVNGLGERAGNAALEEVVMAFELGEKIKCGINTMQFTKMSQFVAGASNRPLSVSKPITGDMVLSHESGVHINSIINDRKTYQIIDAEMVGRKEDPFVFGKHSGKSSLQYFFEQNQIEISSHHCNALLTQVKEHSHNTKRSVSADELLGMYNRVILDLSKTSTTKPIILMHKSLSQIESEWLSA
jgi:homocitrate synthase NifV